MTPRHSHPAGSSRARGHHTVLAIPHVAEIAALATAVGSVLALPDSWRVPNVASEWAAALLVSVWGLLVTRAVLRDVRQRRRLHRRVVILGSGRLASWVIAAIESSAQTPYSVAGVADSTPPATRQMARRWLGTFDELDAIIARERPARLVIAIDERRGRLPLDALVECRVRGVPVDDAMSFYERVTGKLAIEALPPASLFLAEGFRTSGGSLLAARLLSVATAAAALVVLSPVLALIALAIVLDSGGPVLFVQERIGKDGRPFPLLKFRTMVPSADRRSEWVRDNDHRITRVGRWLRRCRADELPQLVNVVRGEMNLVGPRPHPTSNARLFSERIEYYRHRSAVLPGLTGWAQVRQGYANDLSEETEKMRYDLYYIKHRTFWLDLRILCETAGIMLLGRGAAEVHCQARPYPWPKVLHAATRTGLGSWPAVSTPQRSMGRP